MEFVWFPRSRFTAIRWNSLRTDTEVCSMRGIVVHRRASCALASLDCSRRLPRKRATYRMQFVPILLAGVAILLFFPPAMLHAQQPSEPRFRPNSTVRSVRDAGKIAQRQNESL